MRLRNRPPGRGRKLRSSLSIRPGTGPNTAYNTSFIAALEVEPAAGGGGGADGGAASAPVCLPTRGTIGTEVTISGEGFGPPKGKVFLAFQNAKGKTQKKNLKVLSWTEDAIEARWTATIDPGRYDMFVQPRGADPIFAGDFDILGPQSLPLVASTVANGAEGEVTGRFFGTRDNRPKLAFEFKGSAVSEPPRFKKAVGNCHRP